MSKVTTSRTVVAANTYTSAVQRKDVMFTWMHVIYTSTATAGNRQLRVNMLDADDNVIWDARAGTVQAASLERDYALMWGVYRETAFVDGQIHVPFPQQLILPSNYRFNIADANNVDAADSFIFTFQHRDV